ncbi:MAG: hypothetical protein ACI4XE_09315 [Acutalibacteraceae bacterium]
MKIKTSKKEITVDNLPLLFLISAIVCCVLRCVQVATLIDAETGFYKQSSIVTILYYIVLFGSCLAFCVLSYLSQQSATLSTSTIQSKPLCAVTAIFGISMFINSATSFVQSITSSGSADAYAGSGFKAMMSSGELPKALQAAFALLSALYLFYLAASFKNGSETARKHKIVALAPVGWVAFRLIFRFVSKISFLRVSDLFLELSMLAFMILFFMAFAQVNSGVYSEGFGWRIPAFGLSAALIAFSVNIPRLIFTLVDADKYINPNYAFSFNDLMFCVFAVMLVPLAVKFSVQKENGTEADTSVTGAEIEQ